MYIAVTASRETASPPSATAGGVSILGQPDLASAAFYVDGFNLYHAIDALKQPHLKWLDLWALGSRLLPLTKERLVKVRYFSAKKPGDHAKQQRHQEYINALRSQGVEIQLGHFIGDQIGCRKCGHSWEADKEKESDVGLALSVFDDAYQGVFSVAYLLTADSDHGATARMMKHRFPDKRLVSVVPPGQEASKAILSHTEHKMKIPVAYIEDCLFPANLIKEINGKQTLIYRRPTEYAPPPGWIPPAKRPKTRPVTFP